MNWLQYAFAWIIFAVIVWVLTSLVFWGAWNYVIQPVIMSAGGPAIAGGGFPGPTFAPISFAVALVAMAMFWAVLSPIIFTGTSLTFAAYRVEAALEHKRRYASPYEGAEAWKSTASK